MVPGPVEIKGATVCLQDGIAACAGVPELQLTSSMFSLLQWIAKSEYDESGPSIVHRKCF